MSTKRVYTKIGDIFVVKINDNNKKYFQYIANDYLQLNSSVIRAFKKIYSANENPDLSEIVKDEVSFYAHCVINWGIKRNLWEKMGNCTDCGDIRLALFRGTNDYGSPEVKISHEWYIWRIGDSCRTPVGELVGENRMAEIGVVVNPFDIVARIKTGKYNFSYPGFE